jgi:DNA-binding CsgD family transcriptional regulator/tetratricopeptide (TPR) repeat protein
MKLLERETAFRRLKEWMDAAARGAGGLAFVSGEAGVGKTALLRTFAQAVEGISRVAFGACDPLATPRPLGPLLDIHAVAARATQLMSEGAPRAEVFASALRDLGAYPTLVVFEDAQWADEATLDLLQYLGRRLQETRALMVVTFREDEVGRGHPLTTVLGDLATMPSVRRMTLPPLSAAAVRTLARGSDLDPDELYARTGGNPFFVTEVLASGAPGVPVTVRDAVLARASRLSPQARRVLDVAAVVGLRVEPWLLDVTTETDAPAVDECVRAGMLRAQDTILAFRHELARGVILEALAPQEGVAIHRVVLAALRASPVTKDDVARLAHHAEAAGDRPAVQAYAPEAARRAAELGAHREAASQYARALRFSDGLPAETQAVLLERRARECYLTDQIDEAISALRRAIDHYRSLGDGRGEGSAMCALSGILWCPGRIAEAEATGREAVALLERFPPGHELAMAFSNLSRRIILNGGTVQEARVWGMRALELAERLNDTEGLVSALDAVGLVNDLAGDPKGRAQLERGLTLAQQAGLDDYAGSIYVSLALTAAYRREDVVADHYFMTGIEYCSERDLDLWRYYLMAGRAQLDLERGRWTEAVDSTAPVLRARYVSVLPRIRALAVLGVARARRGEPDCRGPLDEAAALARPSGDPLRIAMVEAARAEAAWLEDPLDAVLDITAAALPLAVGTRASRLIGELALWRWRAGCRDEPPAEAAAPYALQIAGRWQEAADQWTAIGCPYETALALAESGEEEPLRRALEIFEQLGARPAAAMVTRRLREMGIRRIPRGPRPSTRAHPAGLTARELEIVPLLVEGLSNPEIARRIFVSSKTVDHHISSILSKLGVRRRGEVAREAARLGLMPDPATVGEQN